MFVHQADQGHGETTDLGCDFGQYILFEFRRRIEDLVSGKRGKALRVGQDGMVWIHELLSEESDRYLDL